MIIKVFQVIIYHLMTTSLKDVIFSALKVMVFIFYEADVLIIYSSSDNSYHDAGDGDKCWVAI